MADTGTSCPANWMLHEKPVRGCGRKADRDLTCDPVLILVTMNYSIIDNEEELMDEEDRRLIDNAICQTKQCDANTYNTH